MELWIAMSGAVRLLLIDLRDLAVRQGRMTAFQSALGNSVGSTPPRKVFCAD
jgi:hypothetical protein